MKIAFSFFLLIYSRVARRLLGPHDTLPCVLIPWLQEFMLIYTPKPRELQALGVRVYISAKSQQRHGISHIYHSGHTHLIGEITTEHSTHFLYTSIRSSIVVLIAWENSSQNVILVHSLFDKSTIFFTEYMERTLSVLRRGGT